jgi:hypothetical protein
MKALCNAYSEASETGTWIVALHFLVWSHELVGPEWDWTHQIVLSGSADDMALGTRYCSCLMHCGTNWSLGFHSVWGRWMFQLT